MINKQWKAFYNKKGGLTPMPKLVRRTQRPGKALKRNLKKRTCSKPRCQTVLSGYNKNKDGRCYNHTKKKYPRLPRIDSSDEGR